MIACSSGVSLWRSVLGRWWWWWWWWCGVSSAGKPVVVYIVTVIADVAELVVAYALPYVVAPQWHAGRASLLIFTHERPSIVWTMLAMWRSFLAGKREARSRSDMHNIYDALKGSVFACVHYTQYFCGRSCWTLATPLDYAHQHINTQLHDPSHQFLFLLLSCLPRLCK